MKSIRAIIPAKINRVNIRTLLYSLYYFFYNKAVLYKKQKKQNWNIGFVVMTHTMWKEDELYRLFDSDQLFTPILILAPSPRIYVHNDARNNELEIMKESFSERGFRHITYDELKNSQLTFDFIFYQQPYEDGCLPQVHPFIFKNSLICYIPYSMPTLHLAYDYEHLIMNIAWKLFYPSKSYKRMVKKLLINKGVSVDVTGYPSADSFLNPSYQYINYWHSTDVQRKRIVWAPHHSISSQNQNIHQSTFLLYSKLMINIARKYKNEIEVAFNPHPLLFLSLKEKQGWTDKDISDYIHMWKSLENGIVTLDHYIDVLKTSDALIHDCASFTVEYMYTLKPVLFICKESIEKHAIRLCEQARWSFNAHYKAQNENDIEWFIKNVVIDGMDNKKEERKHVYQTLIPPYHKTASQNIYESIKRAVIHHA